jgi:signal transduction histidine kinase
VKTKRRQTLGRAALCVGAVAYLLVVSQLRGGLIDPAAAPIRNLDPLLVVGHVVAGLTLVGSGLAALLLGVVIRTGVIATLAGMAWFAPALVGLALGLPVIRAAGAAAALLIVPLIAHVVVSVTAASAGQRTRRALGAIYVVSGAVSFLVLVSYTPWFDPRCVEACGTRESQALIGPTDAQRAFVRYASPAASLAAGTVLIGLATSGAPIRRRGVPGRGLALLGGLLVGVASTSGALSRLARTLGLDVPSLDVSPIGVLLAAALAAGTLLVAVGVLFRVAHLAMARARVRRIAEGMAMAPEPGSLRPALESALGDPTLRVGYWWAEEARYVDVDGVPFDVSPGPGRTGTTIQRHAAPVAVVEHRDGIEPDVLTRELRPSVLVALDNERLRATQLAHLRELRASRARIVDVGDAARRRVERDLHDGAQQHLLAIAFDLRLGRLTAEREGDHDRAARLGAAEALAIGIVDELRRLCRGIHPQVLSQAGLGPALASLAEEAAIPLEVRTSLESRLPPGVETAAYQVVVEALDQASRGGAHELSVELSELDGVLTVEATQDRDEPLEIPTRLIDRVGAAGGELLSGAASSGGYVRAVLPCA